MAVGRVAQLGRPLTVPQFRRLWVAQLVSEVGDWSARLALSVLLYLRTGSPALTALVTTASLVPWLGPGQLLTSVTERWPRRNVMVAADLLRAAAFLVVLLPLPVPALLAIVFCAGLATPPFEAARSAMRPEILPAPLFPPAVALSAITQDISVALGYLAGGALVGGLGASTAVLCNAGSFAASALLLIGLPPAPPPRQGETGGGLRAGLRALTSDPFNVRAMVLVTAAMLVATSMSALSAPLVFRVLGGGPATVAALVAVASVVSIVATAAVPPGVDVAVLLRWAAAYTLIGGLVVVGCFTAMSMGGPRAALAGAAFAAAGLLFAVLAPANIVVSPRLPRDVRASSFSLLMGMLVATEAMGAAGAGVVASAIGVMPVFLALGLVPLAVGAWAVAVPASPRARCLDRLG